MVLTRGVDLHRHNAPRAHVRLRGEPVLVFPVPVLGASDYFDGLF